MVLIFDDSFNEKDMSDILYDNYIRKQIHDV
jgi:hypothetical protein